MALVDVDGEVVVRQLHADVVARPLPTLVHHADRLVHHRHRVARPKHPHRNQQQALEKNKKKAEKKTERRKVTRRKEKQPRRERRRRREVFALTGAEAPEPATWREKIKRHKTPAHAPPHLKTP